MTLAPGMKKCATPTCNRNVMASGPHTLCAKCRPQPPRQRKSAPTPYHRRAKP